MSGRNSVGSVNVILNSRDYRDLLNLAYRQFGWLLGLNPFNQSIMWGEGYRYQALYTPLTGNIVGAVPCGVQTHYNQDTPYWPG